MRSEFVCPELLSFLSFSLFSPPLEVVNREQKETRSSYKTASFSKVRRDFTFKERKRIEIEDTKQNLNVIHTHTLGIKNK